MTPSLILDCSIVIAWFFEDESTPATESVLTRMATESALVPAIWPLEIANTLLMAERRGRTTRPAATSFIQSLRALDIQIEIGSGWNEVVEIEKLAHAHRLTSYDAAYLELAIRKELPLCTPDGELRAACQSLGLTTLGKN